MSDGTQMLRHNLNLFNNSVVQLLELIQSNWNNPALRGLDVSFLQQQANEMHTIVLGVIKAKSENIVENIIPVYFDRLSEVDCSPSPSKKRKLVTFQDNKFFPIIESHAIQSVSVASSVETSEGTERHGESINVLSIEELFNPPVPDAEWLEEDEVALRELVAKYKSGPKGRRVVDWSGVARELRRNELDCKVKWSAMCDSMAAAAASGGGIAGRGRKGPYKVEEDQLIMTTVQDYLASANSSSRSGSSSSSSGSNHSDNSNDSSGDANDAITAATIASAAIPNDVWDSLEKTMGRPAKNIRLRWRITLAKRSDAGGGEGNGLDDESTVASDSEELDSA